MTGYKLMITGNILVILAFIAFMDAKKRKIGHRSCGLLLFFVLLFRLSGLHTLNPFKESFIPLIGSLSASFLPCLLMEGVNGLLFGFKAIGGGDIRLFLAGCLLVGPCLMWEMVFLACLLFLLQCFLMKERTMPFGPAICTAVAISFLWSLVFF